MVRFTIAASSFCRNVIVGISFLYSIVINMKVARHHPDNAEHIKSLQDWNVK